MSPRTLGFGKPNASQGVKERARGALARYPGAGAGWWWGRGAGQDRRNPEFGPPAIKGARGRRGWDGGIRVKKKKKKHQCR